jgi:Protein of unknown function (DUF3060)
MTLHRILACLFTVAAAPALAAPFQQNGWLIYRDSHVEETLPCAEQPILLEGSHTDLTLHGTCLYVRIAGEHNDIAIDIGPAATIEITGAHNDVTWRKVVPGPPPRLLNTGPSNAFHHPPD